MNALKFRETILNGWKPLHKPQEYCICCMLSMWQESILRPYGDLGRYEDYKQSPVELQTKVHPSVRNHGECPFYGLLLVESA